MEPPSVEAIGARKSLQQGDWMENLVESTVRSMFNQMKAEYQKELRKALEATDQADLSGGVEPRQSEDVVGALRAAAATGQDRGGLPADCLEKAPQAIPGLVPPTGDDMEAESVRSNNGEKPHREAPSKRGSMTESSNGNGTSPKVITNRRRGSARSDSQAEKTNTGTVHKDMHRAGTFSSRAAGGLQITNRFGKDEKEKFLLSSKEEEALKSLRRVDSERSMMTYAQTAARTRRSTTQQLIEMSLAGASASKTFAIKVISSRSFDFVMGLVIIGNAVTIGMESSATAGGNKLPIWLVILEYIFLAIYMFEIFLRFHAVGVRTALTSRWVKFDAVLVVGGLLNLVMVAASVEGREANAVVGNINMLKLLRLFRLARTVRVFVQFRTLWLLVQGLMSAALPMLWTCLMMFIVVYVFAVIGMETIIPTAGDMEYDFAKSKFDTMGGSMLTLMQFMFVDSVAAIYRPLVWGSPALILYFTSFLLIGPVALMGIVTAILVESSLRTANEDMEAKKAWDATRKKEMMPRLVHLFETLDQNGDDEIDLGELFNCDSEVRDQIQRIVALDELEEIFHLLDVDKSGAVSIEEFIDGIMRSQDDKPSELLVLIRQGKAILEILQSSQAYQGSQASQG